MPAPDQRTPVAFRADGDLYAASFRPAELAPADRPVFIGVYIAFDYGGEVPQKASFIIHYTPERAVPARFTGAFRDSIAAGSLRIEAGVEVARPGHYVIDCNLYDADDNPVAWTRFKGELATGTHDVPLDYFGKVLVDSKATPPFHIGELRGYRFVEGADPDQELMRPFDGELTTADYRLEQFSDAPWDSPEKRAKIERLRRQLGTAKAGFGAPID
jgi:hypothetical protein